MSADESRRWLHELRNAINALCVTSAVLNRVLADGNPERAREVASELESGCERCRELMESPPGAFHAEEGTPLQ